MATGARAGGDCQCHWIVGLDWRAQVVEALRANMRNVHRWLEQLLAGVSIVRLAENTGPETLTLKPRPRRTRRTTAKAGR